MKILVVEDDSQVSRTLEILFARHNYAADTATDSETALEMVEAYAYDLILLDVLLPGQDGIGLCETLRTKGFQMPILLLTGQSDTSRKATALNIGADDYVVKPFDADELMARVKALLRRGSIATQPVMEWGMLRLDPGISQATYGGQLLTLTPKEYAILEMFLRNTKRILSPKMLLEHAWSATENPGEETVRGHIKGLRQKLKAAGAPPDFIETAYRLGYRLRSLESMATSAGEEALSGNGHADELQTVLLVTNDLQLAAQSRSLLEEKSLKVLTAGSAPQFWQILESRSAQIIVFDADATEVEPLVLCRSVHQHQRWLGLPILFLTSSVDTTAIHQMLAAGATDFVGKPIAGPELAVRVI